eukprot:m.37667 g.37667  ORF g.37667 m.37667 type:complete len:54 (-) comp7725_c0_seq1:2694-2855(-)
MAFHCEVGMHNSPRNGTQLPTHSSTRDRGSALSPALSVILALLVRQSGFNFAI